MRGDTHYNDIISRHMLLYSATLSSLLNSFFFFLNRRYVARCQPALANVFFPAKCSWDNARLANTDGCLTVSLVYIICYLVSKRLGRVHDMIEEGLVHGVGAPSMSPSLVGRLSTAPRPMTCARGMTRWTHTHVLLTKPDRAEPLYLYVAPSLCCMSFLYPAQNCITPRKRYFPAHYLRAFSIENWWCDIVKLRRPLDRSLFKSRVDFLFSLAPFFFPLYIFRVWWEIIER